MITSCKNWQEQVKMQKSTNNPMSSFGIIEVNTELSHKAEKNYIENPNLAIFSKSFKVSFKKGHF